MAATPSAEQTEIRRRGRQRLIGAIAIVVLAVVFVPMVLDSEPRQDRKEPALAIPPKEGAPALPAPPPAAEAPKAAEPAKVEPAKAAPAKSADLTVKSGPPPKVSPPAPRLQGFAVQVGAFRDEDTLRQAREKLASAKIAHFIERLPDGLTRLRAGPYPTREAAEKAGPALAAAGFKGQVVALP